MPSKARVFWPVTLCLLVADCATKRMVVAHVDPSQPREVLGSTLRLTLAYNKGTVFGFLPGPASRAVVVVFTLVALAMLLRMYRSAAVGDRAIALALGLVAGGAVGNLLDRVRWSRGVVDFIDAGAGDMRFWIFNVADVGVTVGAVLLAALLWRRSLDHAATA
jgi:signal peptidase II